MKRTKKKSKTVHAILTADWHLREDTPVCRTDNFTEAQWAKVEEVSRLQKKYDCPVFHAGDLFHHWKPSPALLTKCIQKLPARFATVYGNHDLPQHNMDLEYKTGIRTLIEAGVIELLREGHWNHPPEVGERMQYDKGFRKFAVWHNMVWTNKAPFPGAEEEDEGHKLLSDYPQFDLILTGDNHQQFVCKQDGRILLNPGNLTRQTAAQKDFEPAVWLWNANDNTVEAHFFDVNPDAVTRIHIQDKQERDERITAFIERLDAEWEGVLDFGENLRRFGKENEISEQVMDIAYKALEA